MSKQFENKVVLITGGTSGIGRVTAVAFAKEGAKVVVTGRNAETGAETFGTADEWRAFTVPGALRCSKNHSTIGIRLLSELSTSCEHTPLSN